MHSGNHRNSENLNELFTELSKAQSKVDAFAESKLCHKISLIFKIPFKYRRFSNKSYFDKFMEKVSFGLSDCWYWSGCTDKCGYGRMASKHSAENFAHRHSWILFHGEIPENKKVCHSCDIRCCVNPDHLFLGTQKENVQDMIKKGRRNISPTRGEKNHFSKLTNVKVLEIRKIYSEENLSYSKLGKLYGVAAMSICRIVNKKSWSHV